MAQTSKIDLEAYFRPLTAFLQKVPSITGKIGTERQEDGTWSGKFTIDIDDKSKSTSAASSSAAEGAVSLPAVT